MSEKLPAAADNNQPQENVSLAPAEKIEEQLEAVMELPPQEREKVIHKVTETFLGVLQSGIGPRLDKETAKIIAETVDKDNERKFKYATQQQADEHELALKHHRMLWPVLIAVLAIVVGCIIAGIYFCTVGKEVLGASLITGATTGAFGYLAGRSNPFSKSD